MYYFDEITGERRMKRRYVMAFWGFALGSLFGVVVAEIFFK